MIASTSRFSAKETIDTVPTSRYALRTPLASATWSLAPTNLTGPTSTRARAGPPVPSLIRSADGGIPNPDRNRSGDRISCSRASGPPVAVPRRERVTHHEQPRLKWNDYAGAPPRHTVKHRCRDPVNGNGREAAKRRRHVGGVDVGQQRCLGQRRVDHRDGDSATRSSWRNASEKPAIACMAEE